MTQYDIVHYNNYLPNYNYRVKVLSFTLAQSKIYL